MGPRSSRRDDLAPRGRGGDIVVPRIERYLESLETTRDAVLTQMERQAAERDFPIVGPLVGRMLCLLAQSIGARRILELGSGYGYSAYWFTRALPDDGELILTEASAENLAQAKEFFREGGVRCRVRFEPGDAFEILERLPGEFDIIFNDVDKQQYPSAFHKAVPRVRRGGYFLSDNMLWGGRVVEDHSDPTTRGVLELTRLLFRAPNLYTTILPIRDGVSVSLKLQ
ncbi:MAG: O-methyltransferase [candidate division NC10 bacterium]|nr:O-methyltransferase [candidate division NC10 bacterium]